VNKEKYIYTFSSPTEIIEIPEIIFDYNLSNNYPNPFNPSTTIQYQIPEDGFVSLKVYDIIGSEVTSLVNQYQTQGKYIINFNAFNLPSGIFIYQIKVNAYTSTKKMTLLK